ncbi:MAG: cadherin-like domain-containing protein [Gammaproteobacteria bacterium]|nr:cadherin-like domain-containing protein [Gammaproteobacteria bacterium]
MVTFTYEPFGNFVGTDQFSYVVRDGRGESDTATVTVSVFDVNNPPVNSVPASVTAPEDTITAISTISASDSDGVIASVTVSANNGFFYISDPAANTSGIESSSITFTGSDTAYSDDAVVSGGHSPTSTSTPS